MSKRDAAPTHSWIIMSHINRFVVRLCLFLFVAGIIVAWTIAAKLEDECDLPYEWSATVFDYTVELEVGKTPESCPYGVSPAHSPVSLHF